MKIKVNKSTLKEIKKDTPQYEFTKDTKEKKHLKFLFDNKYRIVVPIKINVKPVVKELDDIDQVSAFCLSNSFRTLEKMNKVHLPTYDEAEKLKNEKLKKDIIYTEYVSYLKTSTKDGEFSTENLQLFIDEFAIKRTKFVFRKIMEDIFKKKVYIDFSKNTINNKDGKTINLSGFIRDLELYQTAWKMYGSSGQDGTWFAKASDYAKKVMKYAVILGVYDEYELEKVDALYLYHQVYAIDAAKVPFVASLLNKFFYETLKIKGEGQEKDIIKTIVMSRVPRDIVRMSDFSNLQSCHSVGGSFSSCATQEAISDNAGAVAFLFDEMFDEETKNKIENSPEEFMIDKDREETSELKFRPISRIRIRTYSVIDKLSGNRDLITLPTAGTIYGRPFVDFKKYLKDLLLSKQTESIRDIKQMFEEGLSLKITLFGGTYSDDDLRDAFTMFMTEDEYDNASTYEEFEFKEGSKDNLETGEVERKVRARMASAVSALRHREFDDKFEYRITLAGGIDTGHPFDVYRRIEKIIAIKKIPFADLYSTIADYINGQLIDPFSLDQDTRDTYSEILHDDDIDNPVIDYVKNFFKENFKGDNYDYETKYDENSEAMFFYLDITEQYEDYNSLKEYMENFSDYLESEIIDPLSVNETLINLAKELVSKNTNSEFELKEIFRRYLNVKN